MKDENEITEERRKAYVLLRKKLGPQYKVAAMLGITRETLNKRERGVAVIYRESELALQALAALPQDEREPVVVPKTERRASVILVMFGRALEEAADAKRRERLMLADLQGKAGVCVPVRGPRNAAGQISPRWEFWVKSVAARKKAAENVTIFARALRAAGQLEEAKQQYCKKIK